MNYSKTEKNKPDRVCTTLRLVINQTPSTSGLWKRSINNKMFD